MVRCEPNHSQTKELHGFGNVIPTNFENRVGIVLDYYGNPLPNTSSRQLLPALQGLLRVSHS